MPGTAERVVVIWDAKGESDSTVGGDDFEDDAEDAETWRGYGESGALDDTNEEDCEDEPPQIVS